MKITRNMATLRCMLLCAVLLCSSRIWGQDQDQYIKTMNSLVPATPEAATLMRYIDFPVSLYTGTPNINIPLVEVKGKGISVPLSLSYADGSGIPVNQIAASTGLGFVLSGSGEITREVRGAPDEQGNGIWYNAQPVSYYANIIQQTPASVTAGEAAHNQIDLEPDMFYFSLSGKSGKFIYDETTHTFICTDYQPYKITHDGPSDSWLVIAPDGSKYTFTLKVKTTTNSACNNANAGTSALPITTSWKLTKIVNADNTDSIALTYNYNTYNYISEGSSISYQLLPNSDPSATSRPNMNCFSHNNITGYDQISNIASSRDTVNFVYATTERQDLPSEFALSQIVYSNGNDAAKQIFQLDYDYYLRNNPVGTYTDQEDPANKKSLRLIKITNFGNSATNPNPPTWSFSYNSAQLASRLSYAQDFWGYTNSNTNINTLVPADIDPGTNSLLVGADRTPDNSLTAAGILDQITFPTGGTTTFEYEPNDVGYVVPMSTAQYQTVTIDTNFSIPSTANNTGTTYAKTFTINEPPDPITNFNNPNGGANVSFNFLPQPMKHPGSIYVQNDDIYYDINNQDYLTNTNNIYLANNTTQIPTYTVKIDNSQYLNAAPYLPVVGDGGPSNVTALGFYTISYRKLLKNAYGISNRQCGGVRIKSITTYDAYRNVTMKKQYGYHNLVTDSSYGNYFGATTHGNYEYQVSFYQSPAGGTYYDCISGYYLARHGNCIMPGTSGLNVVYPKVYEYTMEGNKQYMTEHNFSVAGAPFYNSNFPFVPPLSGDAKHGKETSTIAYKNINNSSDQIAKSVINNYNFDPTQTVNPNVSYTKTISAYKVAYGGYSNHFPGCGFDYVYTNMYGTEICRPNLASDSTFTYDLNNQYTYANQWHDYTYGDYNGLPTIVRTGNSDGSVSIQKNYFASDQPDNSNSEINNMPLSQLTAANRVTEALGSEQYKDGELLSQAYYYGHFDPNNHYLKDSMRHALFSNPLDLELKVLSYDNYAEPTAIWLRGNKYRQYIWYASKGLPLATCVSPRNDFFYFTSFEYPGSYASTGSAFSGSNSYNLSGNTLFIPSTTALNNEDVYVWAVNGVPSVNGSAMTSTGKTKGSWTLYSTHISNGASSVSISGSATIDQLVVMPTGGQLQGIVYDAGNRIVATVNSQIETNFYQYDAFGRLSAVTDEQGNILKKGTYQYQTAQ